MTHSVIIIGGGQAASQACASLRQFGFEGRITLVCEEAYLPYQRPPLSKAYMKDELTRERLFFKPLSWYEQNDINLLMSTRVMSIDRTKKCVELDDGTALKYGSLIFATGSRPRPLPIPGAELSGVFDLRTLDDVDCIKPYMTEGRRIAIIGAGYIGLEAAAVARQLGLEVIIIEMADRVLSRVTSPYLSEYFEQLHEGHGVDIRTSSGVVELFGDSHVSALRLANGCVVLADLVLAGIGIIPNIEVAEQAGIKCGNGILVNEDARTSDPNIFAIGDCSLRPLVHYDRVGRLESVHNALEQGKIAAAAIVGRARPLEDCPWFWSDQYDIKLQIAGLSNGFDEMIVRGDPATNKFAVFYLKDNKLIAVDAVNRAPEFMVSKKLIISRCELSSAMLVDEEVSMKDIWASVLQG